MRSHRYASHRVAILDALRLKRYTAIEESQVELRQKHSVLKALLTACEGTTDADARVALLWAYLSCSQSTLKVWFCRHWSLIVTVAEKGLWSEVSASDVPRYMLALLTADTSVLPGLQLLTAIAGSRMLCLLASCGVVFSDICVQPTVLR